MNAQPVLPRLLPVQPMTIPPRSRDRFAPRAEPAPAAGPGEPVRSRDGRRLFLRSIRPGDVAALKRCFTRLSPDDIRRRFLHAMAELPEPMAQRLCTLDAARETAFVLMDEAVEPAEMRGVGRIYVDEAADSAEFSVLVEHDWTRLGLGALLMQRLVDDCRRRGLHEVWGYVLLENRPMLELCRELGFRRRPAPDEPGITQIALQF